MTAEVITTAAELLELPVKTALRGRTGAVIERMEFEKGADVYPWQSTDHDGYYEAETVIRNHGPLRVIDRPDRPMGQTGAATQTPRGDEDADRGAGARALHAAANRIDAAQTPEDADPMGVRRDPAGWLHEEADRLATIGGALAGGGSRAHAEPATRGDMFRSFPAYMVSYDLDGGGVFAIDLVGHGHDLDLVELFLHTEGVEIMDDGRDETDPRGWEISEVWRRAVPMHDEEHEGCSAHHYQGHAQRGATPVTHLEPADSPRHWCINHLDRPGSVGVPASRVVDGEAAVARELARAAEEIDPRATVDAPTERLGAWRSSRSYLDPGYIYMCRECSSAFSERERLASVAAMAEYNRERAARTAGA